MTDHWNDSLHASPEMILGWSHGRLSECHPANRETIEPLERFYLLGTWNVGMRGFHHAKLTDLILAKWNAYPRVSLVYLHEKEA